MMSKTGYVGFFWSGSESSQGPLARRTQDNPNSERQEKDYQDYDECPLRYSASVPLRMANEGCCSPSLKGKAGIRG